MTITINKTTSRSSGVAPLAVHFDATGTTDTATSLPFHDCLFTWNFGDATAGVFEYGAIPGQSKNVASGAVAAHVFENPGTYTVTLTVKSPDGVTVQTSTETVTVDDPDVVYGNANTWYVANTLPVAGQGGVPAGATNLFASADFTASITAYRGANRRILFKCGDTFTAATSAGFTSGANIFIGSYGTGPKPLINASAGVTTFSLNGAGIDNLRIVDLDIRETRSNNTSAVIAANTGYSYPNMLVLNCTMLDVANGVKVSGSGTMPYLCIANTLIERVYKYGVYAASAVGVSILGSRIYDSLDTGTHVCRLENLTKTVVVNNDIGKQASGGVHALKFCGGDTTNTGVWLEYAVITGNRFTGGGASAAWTVSIQPQSGSYYDQIRYILVEKNFFTTIDSSGQTIALNISASQCCIRNNVFDLMRVTASYTAVAIGRRGVEIMPDGNSVLNNTVLLLPNMASDTILLNTGVTNSVAKLNLGYGTGTGTKRFVHDLGTGSVVASNSSNSDMVNTDPLFRGTPSGVLLNPHDLNIKAASYAVATTASVPVFDDFFGRTRTGTNNMGAFTYTALAPYAVSRIKGVAPLSVFFDAVASYDAASTDAFHECVYEWNFGDKGDDLWAYGARLTSKNEAQGAVAAHVYETPGLYNATLKITGKDGSVQYLTSQVTVEDPDVVFAGTKTICVSTDGSTGWGPAGCTYSAATPNFNTAIGLITATSKRILLKKGQTFGTTGNANIPQVGPGVIGSYGSGADPIIQTNNYSFKPGAGCEDWRVYGLQFSSSTGTEAAIRLVEAPGKLTYHKLSFTGCGMVEGTAGTAANIGMDQITVSECSYAAGSSTVNFIPIYPKGTRWAVLGNMVNMGGVYGNQALRVVNLQRGVIASNKFMNAGAASGTETLTVRANGSNLSLLCTKHILVSNNELSVFRYTGVTCKASINEDVIVEDVLINNNYIYPGAGSTANGGITITTGNRITARSNIMLETGIGASQGAALERRPTNIWFYNNSLYRAATSSTYTAFIADSTVTNLIIRNNAAYSPVGTNQQLFNINGCTSYNADYTTTNSSNAQVAGTNPFLVGSPSSFNDFRIPSGSYAKGTGYAVPVQRDAYGLPVNTLPDMGAFSYRVVTPQLVATRTSGVGPLAVHFDASDTLDTGSSYPFHECYYEWDFGDPDSGYWTYGALPGQWKNRATGPIAAHVYETPGVYDVTLTVTSSDKLEKRVITKRVTVQDPDIVFAGKATICVNNVGDSDFTGAPTGATLVNYDSFRSLCLDLAVGKGKRILLKRGGSFAFHASSNSDIVMSGPSIIGAYGTGSKPKLVATNTSYSCRLWNPDTRLMDLNPIVLSGTAVNNGCLNPYTSSNTLYLRVTATEIGSLIDANSNGIDNIFVVDCDQLATFATNAQASVYPKGNKWAVLGNTLDNRGNGIQGIRINSLNKSVFSNNYLAGNANTYSTFSIRANDTTVNSTNKLVVSGNYFANTHGGNSVVTISDSGGSVDVSVTDVIVEKNFITNPNATGSAFISIGVGNKVTTRNNICHRIGLGSGGPGVSADITSGFITTLSNMWFYNNSLYSQYAGGTFAGIALSPDGVNMVVKNNIVYAPNYTVTTNAFSAGGCLSYTASNNTVDPATKNTLPYSVTPASIWGYQLNQAQYGYNTGVSVPVHDDFFGRKRGNDAGAIDMGAVETTNAGYKYGSTLANVV